MRTLANKVRVQLQLVITSALGTLATLATGISGNSGHTFGRPKAFSIQAKQLRGRGKKPKAKKRKAKHVKLIYTFEAGGLLSGSAKGEGGLGSAGAVGGAVGLATAAEAAAARARDASATTPASCHGQGPGQDNNRAQEWEWERASKPASERASKRQENTRDKRQKQPMGKVNVVGSEFHKSLQEAAAAGQKFVDFVAQCIQIRICSMIQPNLDFNFK